MLVILYNNFFYNNMRLFFATTRSLIKILERARLPLGERQESIFKHHRRSVRATELQEGTKKL